MQSDFIKKLVGFITFFGLLIIWLLWVVLTYPYPEPVTNGYVIEKIYSVVIENNNGGTIKVELTEDQFNYTKIGQWIDLGMAEGVINAKDNM